MSNDPVDRIEWRPAGELKANDYNPNAVFTPELRLLEHNIVKHGWIQPILVTGDGTIIDGFHRWMLARDSKELQKRDAGMVPCVVMQISEPEAMMLTIRMNRAKGAHVAVRMSSLVKRLVDEHGLDPQQIAREIGAPRKEVDLLYQEGVFTARGMSQYKYSSAWYPAENPDA